ncbi:patatin-like protein [Streptomyces sp. DT203]|uniref:patatin-like protein n=1 Tax=Streptomyces sp. DT203 TaxID=3393424 RepID=UPI003CEEB415
MRSISASEHVTEIRLALVMNGGVSLAVWMGGVVHELDLVRRASHKASDPGYDPGEMSTDDESVFQAWVELLKNSDKRVKIDIISGTSAGGLNGLLLATAIGRGGVLPNLRSLWEDAADLKELLKRESGKNSNPKSVLSGKWFNESIEVALEEIKEGEQGEPVTLFVTATALDGRHRKFKDGYGQDFDVRDHRRVYKFKNQPKGSALKYEYLKSEQHAAREWVPRDDERHDFTTDKQSALQRAARATASYPGAFQPVSEKPLLKYRVVPEREFGDPASCVMDGGVLNNAPFGPVLEEITKRPQEGQPVERVIVYIVPSAGRLAEEEVKNQQCEEVTLSTTVLSALNYPQEADFRTGTDDLEQRLKKSIRSTRDELFARLLPTVDDDTSRATANTARKEVNEAARNLYPEYRRSRAQAVVLDALSQRTDAQAATAMVSPPEVRDDELETIVSLDLSWIPQAGLEAFNDPTSGKQWHWGLAAAQGILSTLGTYLNERLLPRPQHHRPLHHLTIEQWEKLAEGATRVNEQLRHVLAIKDAAVLERKRARLTEGELGTVGAALLIDKIFRELDITSALAQHVTEGARMFLEALSGTSYETSWKRPEDVISALRDVEIVTQTFASPGRVLGELTPRFTFLRLGPDSMGPLFHEDWSADMGDRKLYGIRFRHFGAFISREWRASDFAWGRLDAAHHLMPLLVPNDDGKEEVALHKLILTSENSRRSPTPSSDPAAPMRDQLLRLAHTKDAVLLDNKKDRLLREAGDEALNVLMPRSKELLVRWIARRIWHKTWKVWDNREEDLSAAAGKAAKIVALRWAGGFIALGFLGGHASASLRRISKKCAERGK